MKKSRFLKSLSSIVAVGLVLSLLSPFSVLANTQQGKPLKPTGKNDSTLQLKAATIEQLNELEVGVSLHKDLQGLSEIKETKSSSPISADFNGVEEFYLTETDLSFDGDGFNDDTLLTIGTTMNFGYYLVELWDMLDPTGGAYNDGYKGVFAFGDSLPADRYELHIDGMYLDWATEQEEAIPDGLYTIDFTGFPPDGSVSDSVTVWTGPVVVKTTDPVITTDTVLVTDTASFEFEGQVTDKYIDYNNELTLYGLEYDLNSKLDAMFQMKGPDGKVLQNGPITLNQDGSFYLDIPTTVRGSNTLTVTVDDAAGNSGSSRFVIVNNKEAPIVDRIYGEDRIKTAIAISKEGWDTASTVILALGYDFPDALAASPLAYQLDAPILLTKQKSLAAETIAELKRLKTENVIIVGGDNAVSKTIDASLISMGISVERIAGDNRFDTAARIAKRMGGNPEAAIVTDGYNYPDALAISSFAAQNGYPILLTRSDRLPIETNKAVESIPNTIVMGGNKAVSPTVFNQLNNPMRIAGNDRYATAVAVVELLGISTERVYVATGQGFADALTGSVLAAKNGAPIILVKQNSIPEPTAQLIEYYDIRNFTLLGGEVAISGSLFQ
ncbi:cell wall-binding repeat-containing protein [Paenisporosarcina sp. TG20]|uniref:cell wall-binding repeat-containing protein n=1 Tax=Paenisporosarcina sp. TG20 TaxID=1211706 RepID=UPI0002E0157D|nr:cell wall-binding repeat-containing protein [Paenisporosarcina sp. TG20]